MRDMAWSPAWTRRSGLGHEYRSRGSKDCNESNDIHSKVEGTKRENCRRWTVGVMIIMVGGGDDIYDGFVYIPWVIVSLGHP